MRQVIIANAKRTPFGNFGGALKEISNVELGSLAVRAVLDGMPVTAEEIGQLLMGVCLPGAGLSPCRQVVMAAGLPDTTNAMSVDRACCSSMSAIGIGFERIAFGRADMVVAGGFENMSQTPYLVPQMRWGQRIGDFTIKDELVIRNPYLQAPMALYAGEVAVEWNEGREEQDAWAIRSNQTAVAAAEQGYFEDEIFPVAVQSKKGDWQFGKDEHPRTDSSMEKLAKLKPVYGSPTVTAGNASGICDGATATLLMSMEEAEKRGVKPFVRIVDHICVSDVPRNSPLLPAYAIEQLLARNNLSLDDMELIEINEAFASMPLVSTRYLSGGDEGKMKSLRERLNVNGGAIAIGHPIGATGARITMTLAYEMRRRGSKLGIAAICGAIGQGDAVILERIN